MDADCWFSIFDCLNLREILNCFLVCKQFNKIACGNQLWMQFLENDFQVNEVNQDIYHKYKEYYALNKFLINKCPKLQNRRLDFTRVRESDAIYIQHAKLHNIPPEFGLLTNLKMIYLNCNQLTSESFPSEFAKLINLTGLHLYENNIESIPSVIFSLTGLKKLHMDYNQLEVIPP
jgi:hypothetical protein